MNNTNLPCSLDDTAELRKLILENPDTPLVVFAGEDAWHDKHCYEWCEYVRPYLQELTIYKDMWLDKDDYETELIDDLSDDEVYKDLSDEEFDKMIKQKVAETEFVKAIVLYVG